MKVILDWAPSKSTTNDDRLIEYISNIENGLIWQSFDIVVFCTGFRPNDDIFDEDTIKLEHGKSNFPLLTGWFESVSCDNLYFVGALSQDHDYKKGTSAFIHGFRYNARILRNILFNKILSHPIMSVLQATEQLYKRMNTSSCLLHRYDFVGDLICIAGTCITIYEDIPVHITPQDLDSSTIAYKNKTCVFMKLGYNKTNAFAPTLTQPQTGNCLRLRNKSVFIHPIFDIRSQDMNNVVYSFHLPEQGLNSFTCPRLYFHPLVKLLNLLSYKNLEDVDFKRFDDWLNVCDRMN